MFVLYYPLFCFIIRLPQRYFFKTPGEREGCNDGRDIKDGGAESGMNKYGRERCGASLLQTSACSYLGEAGLEEVLLEGLEEPLVEGYLLVVEEVGGDEGLFVEACLEDVWAPEL